jgi:hypothetical protein
MLENENAKFCKISRTESAAVVAVSTCSWLFFLFFFCWSLLMSHNQWEKIFASNALPL